MVFAFESLQKCPDAVQINLILCIPGIYIHYRYQQNWEYVAQDFHAQYYTYIITKLYGVMEIIK